MNKGDMVFGRIETMGEVLIPVLISLPCLVAACEDQIPRIPPSWSTKDTAGLVVVENHQPETPPPGLWSVSESPNLDLEEGNLAGPLHKVQKAGTLSDGRIILADGSLQSLRVFSVDGKELFTIGREGEGPGEFEGVVDLQVLPEDTVLAFDFLQRRISVFDPCGKLAQSVLLGGNMRPAYVGRLPDGTHLILQGTSTVEMTQGVEVGIRTDSSHLIRLATNGEVLDTIGNFPSAEVLVRKSPAGAIIGLAPFARRGHWARLGGGFVFGFSDEFEFSFFSEDFRLSRLVRRHLEPREISRAEKRAYRNHEQGRLAGQATRALSEDLEFPRSHPAFLQILTDRRNHLWVRGVGKAPALAGKVLWSVFDANGRWLTDVGLPENLRVWEIGEDYVLGLWRNELGLEAVRRYSLKRHPE